MNYGELVNLVEEGKYIRTRYDVVAFLIGYKGKIDVNDLDNISKLYTDGFINE